VTEIGLVVYGIAAFCMSIFGGISGGGAGLIMTPLAIFLGLSPQEAIASGKFGGLSSVAGSIRVLHKEKLHSWKHVIPLMVLALIIGLIAPQLIVQIDADIYQTVIGVLLIMMIPVIYLKKIGANKKAVSKKSTRFGWVLVVIALFLQAVFSSGLGTLVNLVLISFLGMSALEANITKRFSQITLNVVIILGLLGTGLIIWEVVIVGSIANLVGSTIGAKLAIKKGNSYVMAAVMVAMFLSGVGLLLT
jgi:uncharacterized membrane protein YfcA